MMMSKFIRLLTFVAALYNTKKRVKTPRNTVNAPTGNANNFTKNFDCAETTSGMSLERQVNSRVSDLPMIVCLHPNHWIQGGSHCLFTYPAKHKIIWVNNAKIPKKHVKHRNQNVKKLMLPRGCYTINDIHHGLLRLGYRELRTSRKRGNAEAPRNAEPIIAQPVFEINRSRLEQMAVPRARIKKWPFWAFFDSHNRFAHISSVAQIEMKHS
jgi:hypothetical protein